MPDPFMTLVPHFGQLDGNGVTIWYENRRPERVRCRFPKGDPVADGRRALGADGNDGTFSSSALDRIELTFIVWELHPGNGLGFRDSC